MDRLLFGTAGIPISAKGRGTVEGIREVRRLGLGAMELEFVRNIAISPEKAPEVKKAATENDVVLTCHGPYWINLNSTDPEKRKASIMRVVNSAAITAHCGGWSVCFHAGFYMGMERPAAYERIRESLEEVVRILKEEGIRIWIRPEFAGKTSQWGGIEELVKISREVEMVMPCIDFSHVYARSRGEINTYEQFAAIVGTMETGLGRDALDNMHIHMQGVAYGSGGERFHQNLAGSGINAGAVVQVWRDFRLKGVVICESPNIEEDALTLQRMHRSAGSGAGRKNI